MSDAPLLSALPSGGAAAPEQPVLAALSILEAGGPVVLILGILSVLAATVGMVKVWQFRSNRLGDLREAESALDRYRAGDAPGALRLASGSANPVAQTLARALTGKRQQVDDSLVQEEVRRFGGAALDSLRSWLRLLEVIASLAPLLGLFGTVLGMIEAFRQMESAGSQVNPALLSGGIWEALLTTAVGLAVAMPVMALLTWLERQVERTESAMDRIVMAVFTPDLTPMAADGASAAAYSGAYREPASVPG